MTRPVGIDFVPVGKPAPILADAITRTPGPDAEEHTRPPAPQAAFRRPTHMSSSQVSLDALHAADLGGGPVLDAATFGALENLAGDDEPDLIRDLVALFIEDSGKRFAALERGLESDDVGAVGAAAHALRSSAANVGALEFSSACSDLERCARSTEVDLDELRTIGGRTSRLYADVIAALSGSRS